MPADDDYYLRDTIAAAVARAFFDVPPAPGFQFEFADRILRAIGDEIPTDQDWVVTDWENFKAATRLGADEASAGSCWHYYAFSNGTVAGDTEEDQDPDNIDYLHICCLDDHIVKLVALRELHRQYREDGAVLLCEHTSNVICDDGRKWCQACGEGDR